MKNFTSLVLLFIMQISFAQNTFPPTGSAYYDTSLKIGKQEAPSSTAGEITRLLLQPYGHTGGPWKFKVRDNSTLAFLDIEYGSGGSALTITSDKNVGIGVTNPTHKLEVEGYALFNGGILSSISDITGGNLRLANPTKVSNGIANMWSIYNMTGSYGNSLQFWAYDYLGCVDGGMCNNRFTIMDNGNVGIGTLNPINKLEVNGTIHSKEVKVDMNGWSDFVFKKEYNLPTLEEVEKHIAQKGHLESIPSEKEVLKDGINLGEMNSKLLQKIEELTLYMIEQNKRMTKMEKENDILKNNQTQLQKTITKLTHK